MMTKKEQVTQTQKDLEGMLDMTVFNDKVVVMPHDQIQIIQSAIKFLEEYKEKL